MKTMLDVIFRQAQLAPKAKIEDQDCGLCFLASCSRCGVTVGKDEKEVRNFCPNCGATFLTPSKIREKVLRVDRDIRKYWEARGVDRKLLVRV